MENARALVLGASQGIGKATCQELAQMGYRVTASARSEDKLKKLVAELSGEGHDFFSADIADTNSFKDWLNQQQEKDPFRVLILNSGGPKAGPISQAQPEEFLSAMHNHLVAGSILVREVMPAMKSLRWGRVVCVTSTSVKVPIAHLGVSNTVRAAVASWAKTLSLELAPFGITVNNVMPGFTNTPRLEALIRAKADDLGKSYTEVERAWMDQVPMKRFADPVETAACIGFLCSDKAGYITGQNIAVDGGRLGCL